jgi:hypothetical protein
VKTYSFTEGEEDMNQELQYLRNEINQRLGFYYEHFQKTIHVILFIWSGTSIIFGINWTHFEKISIYFIGATIFFVSNVILYFLAEIGQENARQIFKIAAYISIFYEKRPSKTVKVGNNFSWEIAASESQAKYADNKIKDENTYNMNSEYTALMFISILGISIFTAMCFSNNNFKEIFELISIFVCPLYFLTSLFLFYRIIKNSSLKNTAEIRERYLNDFLQYSLETEHYTEEEIKERFGDFLKKLPHSTINPVNSGSD